jgi:hypothetical protein
MLADAVAIGGYVRPLAGKGQLIAGAEFRNSTSDAKAKNAASAGFIDLLRERLGPASDSVQSDSGRRGRKDHSL